MNVAQSFFDTRNNRLLHPRHIVLNRRHSFTKAYQQADVGILLDEGGNALAGIVGNQWRDGTMAVLRLQPVMVGKGLAQDDVIEHLDDPDTAFIGLMSQKGKNLFVLLKCFFVHLQRKGIILQFH